MPPSTRIDCPVMPADSAGRSALSSKVSGRVAGRVEDADKIIEAVKKSRGDAEGQSPFMTAQATCTAGRPFPAVVTIVTFRAEQ